MIAALAFVLGLCAGFLVAWAYMPRPRRFLALAGGCVPAWTVEHHAANVARALASLLPRAKEQEAAIAAVRAVRVVTIPLDGFDPSSPGSPGHACYYLAGPRLLVAAKAPHWPRHLADGLAHVARAAALGDADSARKDARWFRAAREAVGFADVLPIEEKHGRDAG